MAEAVIYPPTITADKDKLSACYSLLEQMRLEHNNKAADFRSRLTLEPVPKQEDYADYKQWEAAVEAKRKAGFIRPWCPEGYMLADTPENNSLRAKYRNFAQESKRLRKQVLAEQSRLVEKIRWANYTKEQWSAVSKLSLEEQIAINTSLFGDKAVERIKPTQATSPALDELRALSLDNMPERFK